MWSCDAWNRPVGSSRNHVPVEALLVPFLPATGIVSWNSTLPEYASREYQPLLRVECVRAGDERVARKQSVHGRVGLGPGCAMGRAGAGRVGR